MPEYHWNHWIDPIVFPYILPVTQIALTGEVFYFCLYMFCIYVCISFCICVCIILITSPSPSQKHRIVFQEVFTVWSPSLLSATSTSANPSTGIWSVNKFSIFNVFKSINKNLVRKQMFDV